jgi:diguanylate cyclase (GGDEF)-like protein
MNWGVLRLLTLDLAVVLGCAVAQPAFAQTFAAGSTCHAPASAAEDYARLARQPSRWDCTGRDWSIATPRAFLRFDLRGAAYTPTALTTRLTRFAAMRITVIAADGNVAVRDLRKADMTPGTADWVMATALPRVAGPVTAVIVRVDGARHAGLLSDARLTDHPGDDPTSLRHELLIAALCGMLCLPLLFNFAFYRVLRERFLLWHAASTMLMLVHTLVTSGLINRFATLGLDQLSIVSALSVGGGLIAASAFSADLIEPDMLDPLHRRLLRGLGLWIAPWTLFYLFADGPLRPLSAPLYLASFLPVMVLFGWAMITARLRGSRAVNYQIAAWVPVMMTALVRIASTLGLTDAPMEMLVEQHYAMGLEVIITSLGVFDRMLTIRRQRDLAVADLRVFEDRAERDPLTGLQNRRAIEKRFETLRAQGFHTIAIIDLDKFKLINDTHGHVTGDTVLRAAAEALEPDADTLAIRMGGEEFLLLLRGRDAVNRAERRRQAIAVRVAAKVPGLDRMVTASMGMVELPREDTLRTDFKLLYAHCDRLLYEAKHNGRNRTMREKVQSFGGRVAVRAVA